MITLTDKAVVAVKRMRDGDAATMGAALRIRVIPGGCSGMSYKLDFELQAPGPGEKTFEQEGVKVIVDVKSYLYMTDMVIDFRDGLNGSGFVFNNPNAKQTCGCGESFST